MLFKKKTKGAGVYNLLRDKIKERIGKEIPVYNFRFDLSADTGKLCWG